MISLLWAIEEQTISQQSRACATSLPLGNKRVQITASYCCNLAVKAILKAQLVLIVHSYVC